jgi:hypothetical protein
MKRQCPQCRAEVPANARFCRICGVGLPEPPASSHAPSPAPSKPLSEGNSQSAPTEVPVPANESSAPAAPASPVAVPARRGVGTDEEGLAVRLRRAFAVRGELDGVRREAATLETTRERAVALLGEAAWNAGAVPAAASAVAEQIRRLDAEAVRYGEQAAEIDALLARHDAAAAEEDGRASAGLASAQAAYDEARTQRDEAAARLRALETEVGALRAKADAADAAARAARAEADGLGVGNLTAEERIRRDAELDERRVSREREASGARTSAAEIERGVPACREALDAAERLLSERAADRDTADVDLADRRERQSRARAELDEALAEVRARADRLKVDKARLLAALGSAAAVARPRHPTLDALYTELGTVEGRLAGARDRAARLESESARLRMLRVAALSGAALAVLVLLLLVVYALR